MKLFYFFILGLLFLTPTQAQNIRFLKNLPVFNASGSASQAVVFQARAAGNRIYFVAADGAQNYELWITDGRPEGTLKLKDLNGNNTSLPYGFTLLDNHLIFCATDGDTGVELWITDGTVRGTRLLKDINTGTAGSAPQRLTLLDNRVVFFANDGAHGTELWATDGTTDGTALVKDMNPDGSAYEGFASATTERPLPVVDGKVYFAGLAAGNEPALFISNGTTGETRVLINNVTSPALEPVKLGNAILFYGNGEGSPAALWASDLTTAVTTELAAVTTFNEPIVLGTRVFFVNGTGLWETDGTADGTKKTAGFTHTHPTNLTVFKDKLYLYGTNGAAKALLRFDGNTAVQSLSATLNTGAPYAPVIVKDRLYAPVQTSATQHAMIRTDGSTQSFVFAATAPSSSIPYSPKNLFAFHDELYFTGTTTLQGNELWKISAANGKTQLVYDANPGAVSSDPTLTAIAGSQLFLFAARGAEGREYYMSQGTPGNTRMLGNLNPGTVHASPTLDNGAPVLITDSLLMQADSMEFWFYDMHTEASELVFRHPDYLNPAVALEQAAGLNGGGAVLQISNSSADELWLANTTDPVSRIFEAPNILQLGQYAGMPVFSATAPANACAKLSIYNGTTVAALMNPADKASCLQSDFRTFNNKVYFVSQDGNTGESSLWESNGTLAGTKPFFDLNPTGDEAVARLLWEFNNELYFISKTSLVNELWKTDGTPGGTEKVFTLGTSDWFYPLVTSTNAPVLNGKLYFTFYDFGQSASSLIATDGTTAGTVIVKQFRGTGPYLVTTTDRVFFTATTDATGKELWSTDGTTAGTQALDIAAGDASSVADTDLEGPDLGVLGNQVYFRVYDNTAADLGGNLPSSLWVTGGQMANTHPVTDHNGQDKLSNPKIFFPYLGDLYFSAGGFQSYGLWQITPGTATLEVRFAGQPIQRDRPATWGYIPTSDPQTETLTIKNNSDVLVSIESVTWDNDEFVFTAEEMPVTLAAGEEIALDVSFESIEKGKRSTGVTITTGIVNDPTFVFSLQVMATEAALVTAAPVKSSPSYCPGEPVDFKAEPIVNGGFYPLFQWLRNGQAVATTDVPRFTFTGMAHGDLISVTMIPSEDAVATQPAVTSAGVTITVLAPAVTTVQITADQAGTAAPGSTIVLTSQTTNAGLGATYQWFVNDEPLNGATSSALTFVAPEEEGPLAFKLQVTPDTPCPAATEVFSNEILLDIITGLEDPADLQITMHPNPANDKFFITSHAGKPVQATLLDTQGKNWGTYYGKDIMLETSALPEGLYLIRVRAGKRAATCKLIVARD